MSSYIRFLYNVYRDGELYGENLRPIEAARLAGCAQEKINNYSKNGSTLHHKNGHKFNFKIAVTNVIDKPEKEIKQKEEETRMPEEWINDWTNITMAAKALREGLGKIVTRRGRKVTVMNYDL